MFKRSIVLVTLVFVLLAGCSAMGIRQQTDDPFVINKAAYLDARKWYNGAQVNFIQAKPKLLASDIVKYNELLDNIGNALNTWGLALMLKDSKSAEDFIKFKAARDKLIDAGFNLLIKE